MWGNFWIELSTRILSGSFISLVGLNLFAIVLKFFSLKVICPLMTDNRDVGPCQ